MATNTHDHIEVAFVLIRAFNGWTCSTCCQKTGSLDAAIIVPAITFEKPCVTEARASMERVNRRPVARPTSVSGTMLLSHRHAGGCER